MSLCSNAFGVEKKEFCQIIIIIMAPECKIVYRYGDNADAEMNWQKKNI